MFVMVNRIYNKIIIKLAISPILRFILSILIVIITKIFLFSILPVVHAEGWGGTNSIGDLYRAMDENRRLEIEHDKEQAREIELLAIRIRQQELHQTAMKELVLKRSPKCINSPTSPSPEISESGLMALEIEVQELQDIMFRDKKYVNFKALISSPYFNNSVSPEIQNIIKELNQEKVVFKVGDFPEVIDPRVQLIINKVSNVTHSDITYHQLLTLAKGTKNPTIIQLCTCYMLDAYTGYKNPSPGEYAEIYFKIQLEISQIAYGIKPIV